MKWEEETHAVNAAVKRAMWKGVKIAGMFLFLAICSIQDIKEKRVSVKVFVLSGILFLIMSLLFDKISIEQRMYNMLPGMIAFLLAFLTKEQIGYGDALCLIVLGNIMCSDVLWGAVLGGLMLLSMCSILLLAGKKVNRKTTLPFLPFLSAGVLWQVMLNNI